MNGSSYSNTSIERGTDIQRVQRNERTLTAKGQLLDDSIIAPKCRNFQKAGSQERPVHEKERLQAKETAIVLLLSKIRVKCSVIH